MDADENTKRGKRQFSPITLRSHDNSITVTVKPSNFTRRRAHSFRAGHAGPPSPTYDTQRRRAASSELRLCRGLTNHSDATRQSPVTHLYRTLRASRRFTHTHTHTHDSSLPRPPARHQAAEGAMPSDLDGKRLLAALAQHFQLGALLAGVGRHLEAARRLTAWARRLEDATTRCGRGRRRRQSSGRG